MYHHSSGGAHYGVSGRNTLLVPMGGLISTVGVLLLLLSCVEGGAKGQNVGTLVLGAHALLDMIIKLKCCCPRYARLCNRILFILWATRQEITPRYATERMQQSNGPF